MNFSSPNDSSNSNNTKIIKDSARGNGLASAVDAEPGDILISIPSPFILVVEKDALEKVCSYCLVETQPQVITLKRCSGCKVSRYCSPKCQKLDWKAMHQKECLCLKTLPRIPPTPVRALVQVLLQHQHGCEPDPRWAGLESHIEHLRNCNSRWDDIVMQASAAIHFSKSPPERFDLAIDVLARMACNAFRATLADDTPIGLCFEPIMALANHSCEPNAVVVFNGRSVTLRALNAIAGGEQIFIAYFDPTEPLSIRQSRLQASYDFTCSCAKCRGNENAYQGFLKSVPVRPAAMFLFCDPEELVETAKACLETLTGNKEVVSAVDECQKKALSYFRMSSDSQNGTSRERYIRLALSACLPLTEHCIFAIPPVPQLLHDLYLCYLNTGCYLPALVVLLHLFQAADVYTYPQPHHPVRITRLFAIAMLLKHVTSLDPSTIAHGIPDMAQQRVIALLERIDLVTAFHTILISVRNEAIRCHGSDSRFSTMMRLEISDVEGVQGLQRSTADTPENGKAERVVQGLQELAAYFWEILDIDMKQND